MRRSVLTLLRTLVLLLLVTASLAFAQEAFVTRHVNLRHDPSTAQPPIRLLVPPDTIELLEPDQTNGYYHVRTEDRDEGWVWGRNIRVLNEREPTPTSPDTATAPPLRRKRRASMNIWEKPTPNQTTFQSEGKTCGPSGDDGDTAANLLKNRRPASERLDG